MNSFNVYGQTEQTFGGNTPVWLGTVKPIPRGGKLSVNAGTFIAAGTAAIYNAFDNTVSVIKSLDSGMLSSANCFIYNDIKVDGNMSEQFELSATCAIVMHHPEGLLIERVYPEITAEQVEELQAKVPGVLLVRESNQSAE